MKTIVSHFYFDSSEGELVVKMVRLPDTVIFADHKPNPDDIPQDFIMALNKWTEGEQ